MALFQMHEVQMERKNSVQSEYWVSTARQLRLVVSILLHSSWFVRLVPFT